MGPEIVAFVGPVVTAVLAYLRHEATSKMAGKAAEEVGKEAGGLLIRVGEKAYGSLKSLVTIEKDSKAEQSLRNSATDPNDEDYALKLQKELARLAAASPSAAAQMQALASEVRAAVPDSASSTITNLAPNYGAQGQFFAPVKIRHSDPDEHGDD